MGDCNLSNSYTSSNREEKFCKYTYSTWCPTCERNSPRRRSKSETSEPCRRKSKEMKSLAFRKYANSPEYENMDYETSKFVDPWMMESQTKECRIRANLCELPTSYISNNCQFTNNFSNDNNDCYMSVKNTLKFVDLNNQLSKYDNKMHDKVPTRSRELECFYTAKFPPRTRQDFFKLNCREHCPLLDHPTRKNLCYETNTYFNQKSDTVDLKEKYSREVQNLREKLRLIKNHSDYNEAAGPVVIVKCQPLKETAIKTECVNKTKLRRERRILSPPLLTRPTRGKLTTVKNRAKLRKAQSGRKLKIAAAADIPSDCSGSDESEEEIEDTSALDEEQECSELLDDPNSSLIKAAASGDSSTSGWPVRESLFPHIPPYIRFAAFDAEIPIEVPNGAKLFKWKLSTITPLLVRKTLTNTGFGLVRKTNQWLGTWGKHMKSPMFKTLKETQKINHFPGTFNLGRKDKLWRNLQRMMNKFGHKEFGFLPHTYILPQELKLLKQNWEFKNGSGGEMWIIKPPASARGVGIKVINKWSQLPKKTSVVAQKYIANPYLINGSKFDLRLYVLVTSFHPLRIYMYPDGLARFASAKYSDDAKDLKDRYMHLTNYSINKLSSTYTANEDANACHGHKWTISKLLEYLQERDVDTKLLWKNLQSLVIKTMISCEAPITQLCEENINSLYNCYELFGVDVLLDENLKPWLLEVNISPSLHSQSPLDAHVKGPLVQMLFDMAQFQYPPRLGQMLRNAPQCFQPKLYSAKLNKRERNKHVAYTQYVNRKDYLEDILDHLTGDDVRQLARAEDEFSVRGRFERIFPTDKTYKYLDYMEARYYNRLFDAWEAKYADRRQEGIALLQSLCAQKVHLKPASHSLMEKKSPSTSPGDVSLVAFSKPVQMGPLEKIMQQTTISNKVA